MQKKVLFSFHAVVSIKNTSPHVNNEAFLLHPFPETAFHTKRLLKSFSV